MDAFTWLQNAKSWDWSVVGSSNLFWHTLWTPPALLGRAPRRKVCAPMRHTRLKKKWSKMSIFEPKWIRMCLVSANHVGRACTPGMCQARSGAEKDGIYTFLAPLELKLWLKTWRQNSRFWSPPFSKGKLMKNWRLQRNAPRKASKWDLFSKNHNFCFSWGVIQ